MGKGRGGGMRDFRTDGQNQSYLYRIMREHFQHTLKSIVGRSNCVACVFPSHQLAQLFTLLLFRNIAFVAGSFFAVLTCLSLYDQDVFRAEHMLATIASLGMDYVLLKFAVIIELTMRCVTNTNTRKASW